MATVWVALGTETIVLVAAAAAAVRWVRSPVRTRDEGPELNSPLVEQLA